jgi:hypothetical protein
LKTDETTPREGEIVKELIKDLRLRSRMSEVMVVRMWMERKVNTSDLKRRLLGIRVVEELMTVVWMRRMTRTMEDAMTLVKMRWWLIVMIMDVDAFEESG